MEFNARRMGTINKENVTFGDRPTEYVVSVYLMKVSVAYCFEMVEKSRFSRDGWVEVETRK